MQASKIKIGQIYAINRNGEMVTFTITKQAAEIEDLKQKLQEYTGNVTEPDQVPKQEDGPIADPEGEPE